MTQAKTRSRMTFEEFLEYDDGTDVRYDLIDGVPVEVPEESDLNLKLARWLARLLEDVTDFDLFRHRTAVQVRALPGIPRETRRPDLTVLTPELERHLRGEKSSIVKLGMPNPALVAEIVSPYTSTKEANYRRDYLEKRKQYADRGIPEYWILNPLTETLTVFTLDGSTYKEQSFKGGQSISSKAFPTLELIPDKIFARYRQP